MAKRRRTQKCPVCKVEIKADRLESHIRSAHQDQPQAVTKKSRPARSSVPEFMWPSIAMAAIIIVAAVGIYYINRPPPDNEGTGSGNNNTSGTIFPTKYARIDTSGGSITLALYGNETPKTVQNFIDVANQGWYGGTIFHRVMKNFMIQGGGFTLDGFQSGNQKGVPFPPINLETSPKVKNWRGYIAMARTNDPNSATTQFFINTVDNSVNLGPGGVSTEGYAAFGKVIAGMDVVDAIANTPVKAGGTGEVSEPTDFSKLMINGVSIMDSPP